VAASRQAHPMKLQPPVPLSAWTHFLISGTFRTLRQLRLRPRLLPATPEPLLLFLVVSGMGTGLCLRSETVRAARRQG